MTYPECIYLSASISIRFWGRSPQARHHSLKARRQEEKMNKNGAGRAALLCSWAILPMSLAVTASATIWHVGPTQTYKTPCQVSTLVADGDTVYIDYSPSNAPGVGYYDDSCIWTANNLSLIGIPDRNGNRPVVNAAGLTDTSTTGHIAYYQGIWVFYGSNTVVRNMEFENAMISNADGANGAGIRSDGVNLTILNCYIHDNQDGLLESNIAGSNIVIMYTQFYHNGVSKPALTEGYGFTHNVYIGHCASLLFAFNWSHDANIGHLLKSRAAVNYILYNRLTGEDGTDSFEIDLPNGGTSYVIGNLIEKGPNTDNTTWSLTYGEEGPTPTTNPGQDLYVVNNDFVNEYPGPITFVNVDPMFTTSALLQNNIFYPVLTAASGSTPTDQSTALLETNFQGNPLFVNLAKYDYHLTAGSPAINAGSEPETLNKYGLKPKYEYVQPACGQKRYSVGIIDIGAYEFGDGGPMLDCR
jgi:hypothetical protein